MDSLNIFTYDLLTKNVIGPITLLLIMQMSKLKLSYQLSVIGWAASSCAVVTGNLLLSSLFSHFGYKFVLDSLSRIFIYLGVFIAAALLTNQQLVRLIFISLSSFIFVYITEIIGISIRLLSGYKPAELISELLITCCGIWMVYKFRGSILRFSNFVDKKIWRLLCLIPLFLLLTFTFLLSFPASIESPIHNLLASLILCGTSIAIYAVFFYMLEMLRRQYQMEQNLMIKNFQATALERRTTSAANNIKSFVLFRHDLRHIVQMLDICLDNHDTEGAQKLVASIGDWATPPPPLKLEKLTCIRLIDMAFLHYTESAKAAGIQATLSVGPMTSCSFDDAELAVALANILENSIIYSNGAEQKRLNVSGYQQKRNYFLEIANTFSETAADNPDAFINWQSFKQFAIQHNIRYRVRTDNDWFCLHLFL